MESMLALALIILAIVALVGAGIWAKRQNAASPKPSREDDEWSNAIR